MGNCYGRKEEWIRGRDWRAPSGRGGNPLPADTRGSCSTLLAAEIGKGSQLHNPSLGARRNFRGQLV